MRRRRRKDARSDPLCGSLHGRLSVLHPSPVRGVGKYRFRKGTSMYLIVGLGNPGLSYKKTRHNAGFQALDALAGQYGIPVKTKGFSADII